MIYANDQWAQLPINSLYDNQIILASIQNARNMYDKRQEEIKEFKKEYNDFLSPIQKDMEWYDQNVTGKVRNAINTLYANGIDPLRSAEGMAAVRRIINSIDTGRVARNRQSAKAAETYLQNKAALEAAGKYDPDMEERFLGYDINNFDSKNGVWNRLSPVEAKSLKALTESSFNNRTAHLLTEQEVKDFGLTYDPRGQYKGFTQQDLLDIANTTAPGLTGTIYADYFRDLAKQKLIQNGNSKPTEDQINEQLAKDIANQQQEYIIKPDKPDYTDWYQKQTIRLKEQADAIARQRALARGVGTRNTTSGNRSGKTTLPKQQFDYNDFLIGSTAANILGQTSWGARIGVGGVSDYNPESVGMFMKSAQAELAEGIYDYNYQTSPLSPSQLRSGKFGLSFNTSPSLTETLHNSMRKTIFDRSGTDIGSYENIAGRKFNIGATVRPTDANSAAIYDANLHNQNLQFLSQMSMPYLEDNFAKGTKRQRDNDNDSYVLMNKKADVGRIYSADEVALTSAGVNRPSDVPAAVEHTKILRKNFENRFKDGKTMMKSEGFVVGRVGDSDGAHHIFQKIRIVNKSKTPAKTGESVADFSFDNLYNDDEVIYYDMGVDTQESPDFKFTGTANMTPRITDQSLALDRSVLSNLGLSSTNVKSDESVPDIYNSYYLDEDDDLLDLMGY